MAARLCPHCNVVSNFSSHSSTSGQWGDGASRRQLTAMSMLCHNCGGIIMSFTEQNERGHHSEWKTFPSSIPRVDETVPAKVSQDYVSAVNCASIGEFKAAATMFRRCLQQIMLDKSAKGNTLNDQIKDLEARQIITADLKDWAHEIRLWGNEGAHPSDDGLDELTSEEVEVIQDFLERLFDYIYIMPAKVASSRANRDTRRS
jgi:hypothetical protein